MMTSNNKEYVEWVANVWRLNDERNKSEEARNEIVYSDGTMGRSNDPLGIVGDNGSGCHDSCHLVTLSGGGVHDRFYG